MKKLIFTFLMMFLGLNLMAQKHMQFYGIPMTGSVTSFAQKLKSKGFKIISRNTYGVALSGKFIGRNAMISVVGTENGKNVTGVGVNFDPSDQWNELVRDYNYYKDLYKKKYGKPSLEEENNPAISDSNTSLMYELREGRVKYQTEWVFNNGWIRIFISKTPNNLDFNKGCVQIIYVDEINKKIGEQSKLDDI